jgi:aspartate/methionine/tyrosine aminotransferase
VHYAPNLGIPSLRKAIGDRTTIDTGIKVDGMKQASVMAGANEGIMVSMMAFIQPGMKYWWAIPTGTTTRPA